MEEEIILVFVCMFSEINQSGLQKSIFSRVLFLIRVFFIDELIDMLRIEL